MVRLLTCLSSLRCPSHGRRQGIRIRYVLYCCIPRARKDSPHVCGEDWQGRALAACAEAKECFENQGSTPVLSLSRLCNTLTPAVSPCLPLRCGHCKALAPTYEKVAAAFKNEPNCIVANVDANTHRDIGSRYVNGCSLSHTGALLRWHPGTHPNHACKLPLCPTVYMRPKSAHPA